MDDELDEAEIMKNNMFKAWRSAQLYYWNMIGGDPPTGHVNNALMKSKSWMHGGSVHRAGGLPAVIIIGQINCWYEHGKYHRLGGLPALEYPPGGNLWYIRGVRYSEEQVINYYKTLAKFGRFCLKKIRLAKIKRIKSINNQLLCMPPNIKYSGGQDYLKALIWFL